MRSIPPPLLDASLAFCAPSPEEERLQSLILRLHTVIDVEGLWNTILSILHDAVPVDACLAYLGFKDFSNTWQASQILATPRARKPPAWHARRREVDVMPAFVLAHPGIRLYRLTDVVGEPAHLRSCELFRHFMEPEGWSYTACLAFWREDRLAYEIALRRTNAEGDFTPGELRLLTRLHPHIEATFARLRALEMSGGALTEKLERLTRAERALAEVILQGYSNREAAAQLNKRECTVKQQLTSIYQKIGVASRSQLLALHRASAPGRTGSHFDARLDT